MTPCAPHMGSLRHGHSRGKGQETPTYRSWLSMKNRCLNEKTPAYAHYGAVGIDVFQGWLSFDQFLADVGERPSLAHSLDRIDGTQGYRPGNVRWATKQEQNRNRRSNRAVVRSDGLRFSTMVEAAERTGGNRRCIRDCCTGRQKSHHGFTWEFAS